MNLRTKLLSTPALLFMKSPASLGLAVAIFALTPGALMADCNSTAVIGPLSSPTDSDNVHEGNGIGQTFNMPGSGCLKLNSVTFKLRRQGSPGSSPRVRLYEVTLGASNVLTSVGGLVADKTYGGVVDTTFADHTVTFDTPPSVTGGANYLILISTSGGNGSNYYDTEFKASNPYLGGQYCKFTLVSGDISTMECPGSNVGTNPGSRDMALTVCTSPCPTCTSTQCVYSQGHWKNTPEAWPVTTLSVGGQTYSKAELISIFQTPPAGNALIVLAHQLIAAMLNEANGACVPDAIATAIASANAIIDANTDAGNKLPSASAPSSSEISSLTCILDHYNNGCAAGGPAHCGTTTCPTCIP